jgi:hypothetical protein
MSPFSQQTPAKFKVSNASLVVMRAPIRGWLLLEILPTNRDRVALGRACSTCTMAEIQDIWDLSKNDRRERAREGEKENGPRQGRGTVRFWLCSWPLG